MHVARDTAGLSATLQAYGDAGWVGHRRVPVELQRRTSAGSWTTVASGRTAAGGRVHLAARLSSTADYRLVSATTRDVWGATRQLSTGRA